MSCYRESEINIRYKVKQCQTYQIMLVTKNQNMLQALMHLIQLLKDFIALKREVDKLNINKLVNFPTGFNKVKVKVDDMDIGKLKTVLVVLKSLSNLVDNKLLKTQNSAQQRQK